MKSNTNDEYVYTEILNRKTNDANYWLKQIRTLTANEQHSGYS